MTDRERLAEVEGRRQVRRLLCRWFGHRWESRSQRCTRCRRTTEAIMREAVPPPTYDDVGHAYWRGVKDGRRLDRRRAYRLGFIRGRSDAFQQLLSGLADSGLSPGER